MFTRLGLDEVEQDGQGGRIWIVDDGAARGVEIVAAQHGGACNQDKHSGAEFSLFIDHAGAQRFRSQVGREFSPFEGLCDVAADGVCDEVVPLLLVGDNTCFHMCFSQCSVFSDAKVAS